jgi:hypothetical protein
MKPDAAPQPPDRDDRPARPPAIRDDALSWLRTPFTMRKLFALGMFLVGGGIPIALMGGGLAGLVLALMVIVIIAMAMLHDRELGRKRHWPRTRALKRTRGRRRSAKSEGKVAHRTGTRRRGGSGERVLEPKDGPRALRPGGDRVPPLAKHARKGEPARGKVPRQTKKRDHR